MRYQQLSGNTPTIYNSIPSEKSSLLAAPRQEAILTYLSKIDHRYFPEFVKDILTLVENHQLVDITDGSGDEKQDILTITPDGKRCLVQCKHTSDYYSKYRGDDLDLLLGACIRKDCRIGLFITNGDITVQAKRYITDNEYLKGWPKGVDTLTIDYWNYYKIWEKISSNSTILNKWFGGSVKHMGFEILDLT
jgi:restriction endonuclease